MFITLRCKPNEVSVENAIHSTSKGTRPRHSACENCRTRKLKCSWGSEGCTNCVENNIVCNCTDAPTSISKPASTSTSRSTKSSRSAKSVSRQNSVAATPQRPAPRKKQIETPQRTESAVTRGADTNLHSSGNKDSMGTLPCFGAETDLNEFDDLFSENILKKFGGDDDFMDIPIDSWDLPAAEKHFEHDMESFMDSSDVPPLDFSETSPVLLEDNTSHLVNNLMTPISLAGEPAYQTDSQSRGSVLSNSGCSCIADALAMLDKLVQHKQEHFSKPLDYMTSLLFANKSATSRGLALLECGFCVPQPGGMLLVVLIARKLAGQFRELVNNLGRGDGVAEAIKTKITWIEEENFTNLDGNTLGGPSQLGHYYINTQEEQLQVQLALATVRGRNLVTLLERLREMLAGGCEHHLEITKIKDLHDGSMCTLKNILNDL